MSFQNEIKFDPTFGVHPVAMAIAYLIQIETSVELARVRWAPFYNGRERGISVTVLVNPLEDALCVVWGEHRSSDAIFVDNFTVSSVKDCPTVSDFTEDDYAKREEFKHDQYREVVRYVTMLISTFVAKEAGKRAA